MSSVGYFAYGTLQKGFPNWRDLEDRLGEPIGRFRTVHPYGLVVPVRPGCVNPGCGLLHRMAALVPGVSGRRVEGDLFVVEASAIAAIDRLEGYDDTAEVLGPYVRMTLEVAPIAGGEPRTAAAYRVRDPARWRALAATGRAELLTRYEREFALAEPKQCCLADPGHAGPHDVIDPFRALP